MVVLAVACFIAGPLPTIHASQFSQAVDDRLVGDAAEVYVDPAQAKRRGGLELAAMLSFAYDDNIFLSKEKPKSDMVFRAGPSIGYSHGDPGEGVGAFVRLAYRPTAVVYADTKSENRVDHQAEFTAGWRGQVSKITYSGAIQKLGNATADTGRQTDRLEYQHELRAAWLPRERISLELAAGQRESNYSDDKLYDSKKVYGEAAIRYFYSPKTELAIAYQVGRFQVEGSDNQNIQQLTGSIAWKPREKISVHLQAGAERRQTAAGTDVSPVIEGRIDWKPREGTNLFLTGYQRQEASAYLAGQNYEIKGFSVGISQRLGSRWTAKLEGGRELVSYRDVSGTGDDGRSDKIWFVRPALDYKFTDSLNVSLFYRMSRNRSNSQDFGYDQNIAGIELNYRF